VQVGRHHPHLVDGKGNKPFLRRRGGDPDRDLPLSGHRKLGKLAGDVDELLFVFRVQKNQIEGLELLVFRLRHDLLDSNRIGEIGVVYIVRYGSSRLLGGFWLIC
jgi:hypothetical protein